jgi:hypothetical protein
MPRKKKGMVDQAADDVKSGLVSIRKEQKNRNKKIRKMVKDMEKPLKV